jgi:hypothetical protein
VKLRVVDLSVLIGRYTMVLKGKDSFSSQPRTICDADIHKPSHVLGPYSHIDFRNVNKECGMV